MATLFVVFDNWPWFCGTSAVHRLPPVTELALNQLYQGFTSQSIIQKKVKEECCGSATSNTCNDMKSNLFPPSTLS